MPLDHSPIFDAAAGDNAPEFHPHGALSAHNSSWRLLGDVAKKVMKDLEGKYLKRGDDA